MAIEGIRCCGYRKVGGIYIRGNGLTGECDRLNYDVEPCPVCNKGIKFSRAFAWLKWDSYAEKHKPCKCPSTCPFCNPEIIRKVGLMWIGEQNYTPDIFIAEAKDMGISKRIGNIPRGLVMGETWVFLVHRKAGTNKPNPSCKSCSGTGQILGKDTKWSNCDCIDKSPAIFYAFRVERIEKLIWKSEATPEALKALEERGITPIIVPDGDLDHAKGTPKPNKPEGVSQKSKRELESLDTFDKETAPKIETKIPLPEAQEIPKADMDWDKQYAEVIGTDGEPMIETKTLIESINKGIEKHRRKRIKQPLNPGEELKEKLEEPIPDLSPSVAPDGIEDELLKQKWHREELKARFCFGCGSEIRIRGRFCINCGTDIRDIA